MDHGQAGQAAAPLLDQTRIIHDRLVGVSDRLAKFLERVNGAPPASPVPAGTGQRVEPARPPFRSVLDEIQNQLGGIEVLLSDLEQVG